MHSPSHIYTKYNSHIRHPRKPLTRTGPCFSPPRQSRCQPTQPKPIRETKGRGPDIEILSILGWGGASDVPGTDWSRIRISRIASLICAVSSSLCGFPAASSCLRWHTHVGRYPYPEPRTGLASTASRPLASGMLPGYRDLPSVESFSPVISLYYWECKGSLPCSAFCISEWATKGGPFIGSLY